MNKLLLTICLLISISTLASHHNVIDQSKLQDRNGILYTVNEIEPFSGIVQEFYKNGQIKSRMEIENGQYHGALTVWHENG